MSGTRDERFLSEDAQEALKIDRINKREMQNLMTGLIPVKRYTQILGGRGVDFAPVKGEYLFMERNMSIIHWFRQREGGGYKKYLSQLINTVDKIYYFDD